MSGVTRSAQITLPVWRSLLAGWTSGGSTKLAAAAVATMATLNSAPRLHRLSTPSPAWHRLLISWSPARAATFARVYVRALRRIIHRLLIIGGKSAYTRQLGCGRLARTPAPIANLRHVLAVSIDVLLVLDQLVAQLLLQVDACAAGLWQTVDGVHHEVKAVQIVQHGHIEGRRDGALFLIAADMNVVMVGAAVGQPVDQPRVGVEGEDDRLVLGKQIVEINVAQPMRMLALGLQLHQIDDVDHTDS